MCTAPNDDDFEDITDEPLNNCAKCGTPCTCGQYGDEEWGMCEYCCSIICPACIDDLHEEHTEDMPPCPKCGLDATGDTICGVPIDEATRNKWTDLVVLGKVKLVDRRQDYMPWNEIEALFNHGADSFMSIVNMGKPQWSTGEWGGYIVSEIITTCHAKWRRWQAADTSGDGPLDRAYRPIGIVLTISGAHLIEDTSQYNMTRSGPVVR